MSTLFFYPGAVLHGNTEVVGMDRKNKLCLAAEYRYRGVVNNEN
jgi:hypothetical protein